MRKSRSHLLAMLPLLSMGGCWSLSTCGDGAAELAEIASGEQVVVSEIIKGDEIAVTKEGRTAKVRLLGVLAFADEIEDPVVGRWRQAAGDFLKEGLLKQKVTLVLGKTPTDSHGRYLAYVELDKRDINRALLSEGLAMVYTEYGFSREADYLATEAAARVAKKNLWGEQQPASVVRGLREQWARFRAQREGKPLADRLLTEGSSQGGAEAPKPAPKAE